jgi:hypothetical protein
MHVFIFIYQLVSKLSSALNGMLFGPKHSWTIFAIGGLVHQHAAMEGFEQTD